MSHIQEFHLGDLKLLKKCYTYQV